MQLDPRRTAVLTMELQRGVVGDLTPFPELAAEVDRRHVLANTARLLDGARAAGARVVHCTAHFRPDHAGSGTNAPLLAWAARRPDHLVTGTPAVELVPGLGAMPDDLVSARTHGVAPFVGTDLDSLLRNLGVATVVATGVSVNLGVLGLCIEAVDLGYRVVVAVDAVAGVPADYAEAVMTHSIALVATRLTVDEVLAALVK